MDKKTLYTILLLAYVVIMIVMAVVPSFGFLSPVIGDSQKKLHFAEFFVLTIMALLTARAYGFQHRYIVTFIITAVIIVLSESVQTLTVNRHFAYTDMLIDLGGVVLAYIIDMVANLVKRWQS